MTELYDRRRVLPAGEPIVCERGHRVCELSVELTVERATRVVYSTDFTAFERDQMVPQPGEGADACVCRCGASWILELWLPNLRRHVAKLRTSHGWWPIEGGPGGGASV